METWRGGSSLPGRGRHQIASATVSQAFGGVDPRSPGAGSRRAGPVELRTGRHHGSVPPPGDVPSGSDFTEANRRTYDRIARRYADHQARLPPDAGHWLTGLEDRFVAGLSGGAVVADLGCGPAHDGRRLAGRGLQVLGIDLSAGMLDVAGEHLGGRLVQADLRALPVASHRLDGIWSVASLLHVPEHDTTTVLAEFTRVLAPSGSLALVTALGDASRHEAVPYAAEESRWFVYRDPVTLKGQMEDVGLVIQHAEEIDASRRWWTVLASSV